MSKLTKESVEVKLPVPWGHVAARVYGPPKKNKVLVVHGILDNLGAFDRLIQLLPEDYQYVSIDLPGHGLSTPFPPGVPLQFFDYVHTLLLVLDALKWETCIYMAHSFGAHIGTYFSILYPGRFEKFVAVDGITPTPISDIISEIKSVYDLNSYTLNTDRLYTKEDVMYALQYKRTEVLRADAAKAVFDRSVTKVGDLYKYNRDTRLRVLTRPTLSWEQHVEFWKRFCTPALVISAEKSSHFEKVELYLEQMKNALQSKIRFDVVFVNGNHDVHNNYPERVAPYIWKFLKDETASKL